MTSLFHSHGFWTGLVNACILPSALAGTGRREMLRLREGLLSMEDQKQKLDAFQQDIADQSVRKISFWEGKHISGDASCLLRKNASYAEKKWAHKPGNGLGNLKGITLTKEEAKCGVLYNSNFVTFLKMQDHWGATTLCVPRLGGWRYERQHTGDVDSGNCLCDTVTV